MGIGQKKEKVATLRRDLCLRLAFSVSAEKAMEQENVCASFTFLAVSCQFQLPVQRTNPLL